MKKYMIFSSLVLALSSVMFTSCCDEGVGSCDYKLKVEDRVFPPLDLHEGHTLSDISIEGDCLSLRVNESGCDGSTWTYSLVASTDVGESFPPVRFCRFDLVNTEECDAVISTEISFDLTDLQLDDYSSLRILIDGVEDELLYEY